MKPLCRYVLLCMLIITSVPGGFCPDSRAETVIDTALVALSTPSASGNLTTLPTSLTAVAPGSTFYVEIWVKNVGLEQAGIIVAIIDVGYSTSLLDVQQAQVDSNFSLFSQGTIDDPAGLVDELGGGNLESTTGVNDWARLAILTVKATGYHL